jgi:hypothetical protein
MDMSKTSRLDEAATPSVSKKKSVNRPRSYRPSRSPETLGQILTRLLDEKLPATDHSTNPMTTGEVMLRVLNKMAKSNSKAFAVLMEFQSLGQKSSRQHPVVEFVGMQGHLDPSEEGSS